jgi:hypothetical protein
MNDPHERHPEDPGPDHGDPKAALEADIERTREKVAETVDLLAAKFDVKSRVRSRANDVEARARQQARSVGTAVRSRSVDAEGRPTREAMAVGGAVIAAAAVTLLVLWRRRRASRQTTLTWLG